MQQVRFLKVLGIAGIAIIVALVVSGAGAYIGSKQNVDQSQQKIEPFYVSPPPESLPTDALGKIYRDEILDTVTLDNGSAHRVMYRTELPDGTPRVSSAMIFIPSAPAPAGGRRIVAWAHPTVGMGKQCAPSRTPDPLNSIPWVHSMLDRGWIVTATDYAGLGTDGIEYYLIGQNEANDVINSVRMARKFPGADASSIYAVYGHSQGGHSSLWVGERSAKYAPELQLVGVSAAAPATEMIPLVEQLWNNSIGWVIGPEVLISFPAAYPSLQPIEITSPVGENTFQNVAQDCLIKAGVIGTLRLEQGQTLFKENPANNAAWAAAVNSQTPPPLPAAVPAMIAESVNDGIIYPNTIALTQQKWCAAGSTLQMNWLVRCGRTASRRTCSKA